MKTLMVLISLLMLLSPFAQASECTFSSKPQIIFQADHELHQVWSEEGAEVFQSNELPSSPSFLNYLSTIQSKISDLNPYSLLRKEYDDFMNTKDPGFVAEAANMFLALNKQAGTLRSINCLEALLLSQQTERGLSWDSPMEFSAFILKRTDGAKTSLKIYSSTNDRPGGKINSDVMDLIQTDLSNGWILWRHIHNHNFNTTASHGIILVGGPSPGLTDVDLYRQFSRDYGLQSAAVTNGFDTLEFGSDEFDIFHGHFSR